MQTNILKCQHIATQLCLLGYKAPQMLHIPTIICRQKNIRKERNYHKKPSPPTFYFIYKMCDFTKIFSKPCAPIEAPAVCAIGICSAHHVHPTPHHPRRPWSLLRVVQAGLLVNEIPDLVFREVGQLEVQRELGVAHRLVVDVVQGGQVRVVQRILHCPPPTAHRPPRVG